MSERAVTRWGILSTARINDKLIAGARASDAVEMVAVASRDFARAQDYARRNGFERAYGSYEELLAGEEDGEAPPDTVPVAAVPRPSQLPAPVRAMTARPEAQELLDQVARQGDAGAVVITSIGGMGGVGKTTLAVAWARSLAPRFPDGQLYVNLRGFDPSGTPVAPGDALRWFLGAFGVTEEQIPDSVDAQSALTRLAETG